jgi:hypothetical protein
VGPHEPRLAALDPGERIPEVDLARPNRLDLGSDQGKAGLNRVLDRELVAGPAVERDGLLGNGGSSYGERTNAGPLGPAFDCGKPPAVATD